MAHAKQLNAYQTTAVTSASPLQLVIMLYDGAIRFLRRALTAMEKKDLYNQNEDIQRAQRILTELMSCLDMEKGGEVAANLFALYSFCYNQLLTANLEDKPEGVQSSLKVLEGLRESWAEIERRQRTGNLNHVEPTEEAA